ncbi:MAG: ABC transporter ATP-binding protein [Nitrospinota bacterium]|nr:ABC transporter ATP-binding protein [Nitrospinota bacterium]MDP7371120.1 ABC transporter ATP-binding protein [Nitrospinota bacterium]MDP7503982.1 ABC transporter ATP-binding protein [Nitrospinota bacterium]HJP13834.1 ABC transporter ATP-binding protein [Nitrospinota bacterium]
MAAFLSVQDIHTYYGDSYVLQGLSIEVEKGEALGILGRNGMGKTTLINSIMGFVPPRRGKISFDGKDITDKTSYDISALGIGLCPQGRRVFPTLTVRENLIVAEQTHSGNRWNTEIVYELFPRLGERADQRAGSLSGGEQQMLAVGRALMTNPECLILDEPSEGLAPLIIQDIGDAIRSLKDEGLSIILVEQNTPFAIRTVDRVSIITRGQVVHDSSPQELWENEEIKQTHLGIG